MRRDEGGVRKSRYPPSCRVFIGNIDPSVTLEDIEQLFDGYGKVLEPIRMHKGYAFVQYDNTDSAESAIRERNGTVLGGKPIDVQLARGGGTVEKKHDRHTDSSLGKRRHEDDRDRDYYQRSPPPSQYSSSQQPAQKRFRDTPQETSIVPRGGDVIGPPPSIPIFITSSNLK